MVSKTNFAIVGVALLAGLLILRRNGNTSDIVPSRSTTIETTIQAPNPQIAAIQGQIKQVEGFIKTTFQKTPFQSAQQRLIKRVGKAQARKIIQRSSTIDGVRVPSRNQTFPKGSQFGTDPFTGLRLFVGAGPRGNERILSQFFQTDPKVAQTRISFGTDLFKQSTTLLDSLKEKLGLLQTTNTV